MTTTVTNYRRTATILSVPVITLSYGRMGTGDWVATGRARDYGGRSQPSQSRTAATRPLRPLAALPTLFGKLKPTYLRLPQHGVLIICLTLCLSSQPGLTGFYDNVIFLS